MDAERQHPVAALSAYQRGKIEEFLVLNDATVREAARRFGVSVSTVHRLMADRGYKPIRVTQWRRPPPP